MCEPISWVERDKECYFVTLADLKSERGQELLKTSRDNDPLGHGFVRAYWNIPTGVGKDHEVREFWKPSKYPKDIRVTLGKNFDKNWSHIWQYATNDDLRYIVVHGKEKYKDKAWELLLPKATNYDLRYIVEYGTEKYKDKACEILLPKATNYDLRYIVAYGTAKYKDKAHKELDRRKNG